MRHPGLPVSSALLSLLVLAGPAPAQAVHTVLGGAAGDNLGSSIAAAGDVNGDGFEDVVIGAPFGDVGGLINSGRARVVSGLDGSTIHSLGGVGFLDLFGRSVAGVSDLNGDGRAEVAVGAFFADTNGPDAGAVDVFDGATGALLASISGTNQEDQFGQSVAPAGDVDQDGVPDLLVGAWAADGVAGQNSGAATVISGATFTPLFTFQGSGAGDNFGVDVAGPGDVDGDGFVDVVVGAWASDLGGADAGAAFLFSGQTGFSHLVVPGLAAGDQLGLAVDAAGDVDGDGFADVVLGAKGTDGPNGVDAGAAWVVSGLNAATLHLLHGAAAGDEFGTDVGGAGDRDADGVPDVIVGAQFADGAGVDQGSATVFSGATGAALRTYEGAAAGDRFGRSVAGGFDANGDGLDDVAIGAPGHDAPGGDAGMARIHFECLAAPVSYGSGCPGSGGIVPTLSLTGCTVPGQAVTLEIGGGLGGSVAGLMLGTSAVTTPLGGGCDLLIAPVALILSLPLGGAGAGNGSVILSSTIPVGSPSGTVTMQAFILDPASPPGASLTQGISFDIP